MPKNQFRFCVGALDGTQSSSYKIWSQSDELYMLTRDLTAGHQKFSFHSSGECRWARIDENISGKERAILEWNRAEIKDSKANEAILLMTLGFPTNHLSIDINNSKNRAINWIAPAPVNQAVMIQFMLSKTPPEEFNTFMRNHNKKVIYNGELTGDRYSDTHWYVTKADFECGTVEMNMTDTPDLEGRIFKSSFFPDDPTITKRPLRLRMLMNKTLPPYMWELGGYEIQQNSPKYNQGIACSFS